MLEAIFAMKSYTIHHRTGSRDINDLWYFLRQGKTLADILRVARLASPSVSDEHAKAVDALETERARFVAQQVAKKSDPYETIHSLRF